MTQNTFHEMLNSQTACKPKPRKVKSAKSEKSYAFLSLQVLSSGVKVPTIKTNQLFVSHKILIISYYYIEIFRKYSVFEFEVITKK